MKISSETANQIQKLQEKYKNSGQNLTSYLDGLLYERYLTYWDYIHLDTLLSIQVPRTHLPDEEIFIMYHQITELYFKLIIHEQKQIIAQEKTNAEQFLQKINRINNYFKALISSFEIMITGMDRTQFLQFRMALLPASGFQSAQFRMIELYTTSLENLIHPAVKEQLAKETDLEILHENSYWKKGATDLETGEKTLTLKQFEERYTPRFLRIANQVQNNTLYDKYLQLPQTEKQNKNLIKALKNLDTNVNINWKLVHMGSAYKYLKKNKKQSIEATGGTNWSDYLPPSFQKIIFFPEIWTATEKNNWGKKWVENAFSSKKEIENV